MLCAKSNSVVVVRSMEVMITTGERLAASCLACSNSKSRFNFPVCVVQRGHEDAISTI